MKSLEHLVNVPIDSQWRSTAEMAQLMNYSSRHYSSELLILENLGHVESEQRPHPRAKTDWGYWWRRV